MNKADYTRRAIQTCIVALPCEDWNIRLIREGGTGRIIDVQYTRSMFRKPETTAFLRGKNLEGYHCYFRPNTARHILVDDLNTEALERLAEDGLKPALGIMTSPDNYQAWVTVSRDDISSRLATSAAKILAHRYDGDMNSAKATQLGRIPELTNRKLKYCGEDGLYPFARIIGHRIPRLALKSKDLLDEAKLTPYYLSSTPLGGGSCVSASNQAIADIPPEQATDFYNETLSELESFSWFSDVNNRSRVDFAISKRLILKYGFYVEDVAAVILHGSEKGRERGEDYAIRTAQRAWQAQFKSREVA